MEDYLRLITVDPQIANGQPCLRGTPPGPPVLISDIVKWFTSSISMEQVLARHKHLKMEDLEACLAYLSNLPPTSF